MRYFYTFLLTIFFTLTWTEPVHAKGGVKLVSIFMDSEIKELASQSCFAKWIKALEKENYFIIYHVIEKQNQNLKYYKDILKEEQPDYLINLGNLKMPEVNLKQRNKTDRSINEVNLVQSYFPLYSVKKFPANGIETAGEYFQSASIAIGQINLAYHHTKISPEKLIAQYCSYFSKNLKYRNCEKSASLNTKALIEDHFVQLKDSMKTLDRNFVTLKDYSEVDNDELADLTFIAAHANSRNLYVTNNGQYGPIHVEGLIKAKNNSRFWNMYSCRIFENKGKINVGQALMLSNSPTLGVIGSTKSGAMAYPQFFNKYLSQGQTFGEALLNYIKYISVYYGGSEAYLDNNGYNGGLIFSGDPTLDLHACKEAQ